MATKLNAKNFPGGYPKTSKTADNQQIESIKSITNLLLRKIEALEKALPDAALDSSEKGASLYEVIGSFEKKLIGDALRATNWSQRRAAQILGVKATTLNAKIKRYALDVKSLDNFPAGQTSAK